MPDDRLGDLDPAERRRREPGADGGAAAERGSEPGAGERATAAERLSELDGEPEPGRREPPDVPPPARTGGRYSWVVGVAALALVIVAAVNTLPNVGRGFRGPDPGAVLPDFAAPSVDGDSDGDANIRQQGAGSEAEGAVPACDVAGAEVVNICKLRQRPVVLTFVTIGCEEALDQVERVRSDFPRVSFVGVVTGESREEAAEIGAEHEWGFPVAVDPDTAVFNLYRAADCPTTVTAAAGGEVVATRNGALTEEELRGAIEEAAEAGGAA